MPEAMLGQVQLTHVPPEAAASVAINDTWVDWDVWSIYSESGKRQHGGSSFNTAVNELDDMLWEGTVGLWYILHKL